MECWLICFGPVTKALITFLGNRLKLNLTININYYFTSSIFSLLCRFTLVIIISHYKSNRSTSSEFCLYFAYLSSSFSWASEKVSFKGQKK